MQGSTVMPQRRAGTLAPEEPDAFIAHVRVCRGAGWVTTGSPTDATSLRSGLSALARLTAGVGAENVGKRGEAWSPRSEQSQGVMEGCKRPFPIAYETQEECRDDYGLIYVTVKENNVKHSMTTWSV
jgi:hypothetical protein